MKSTEEIRYEKNLDELTGSLPMYVTFLQANPGAIADAEQVCERLLSHVSTIQGVFRK